MRVVELLKASQGYDALMRAHGVNPEWVNRIDVYERVKTLMDANEKRAYIFARVGEDVGLHPRQVRRIWTALHKEI